MRWVVCACLYGIGKERLTTNRKELCVQMFSQKYVNYTLSVSHFIHFVKGNVNIEKFFGKISDRVSELGYKSKE